MPSIVLIVIMLTGYLGPLTYTSLNGNVYITIGTNVAGDTTTLTIDARKITNPSSGYIAFTNHNSAWTGSAPDLRDGTGVLISLVDYKATNYLFEIWLTSASDLTSSIITLNNYVVPYVCTAGSITITVDTEATTITTSNITFRNDIVAQIVSSSVPSTGQLNNLSINVNSSSATNNFCIGLVENCYVKINSNSLIELKINNANYTANKSSYYDSKVNAYCIPVQILLPSSSSSNYYIIISLYNPTCIKGLSLLFLITSSSFILQKYELKTDYPSTVSTIPTQISFLNSSTVYTYDTRKIVSTFTVNGLYPKVSSSYILSMSIPTTITGSTVDGVSISWSNLVNTAAYTTPTDYQFAVAKIPIGTFTVNLYDNENRTNLCFTATVANNSDIAASSIDQTNSNFVTSSKYPGVDCTYTFTLLRTKGIPINMIGISLINGSTSTPLASESFADNKPANSLTFTRTITNPSTKGQYTFKIQTFNSNYPTAMSEEGIISNTTTAVDCNFPCAECNATNASYCIKCSNDISLYKYLYVNTNTCSNIDCSDPSTGLYLSDPTFFYCTKCSITMSNCLTCTNGTTCITCASLYFLSYVDKSVCTLICGNGYYAESGLCKQCDKYCSKCTSISVCQECSSAYPTYALYDDSTCKPCSEDGIYILNDSGTKRCKNCSSSAYCKSCAVADSNCTSCLLSYYFYQNSCLIACKTETYASEADKKCYTCDSNCLTCNNTATNCTSCNTTTDYKILTINGTAQSCTKTCSTGFYITPSSTCLTCKDECATCSLGNTCDTCRVGYLFESGLCGTDCSDKKYYITADSLRCRNCDTAICASCSLNANNCTSCNGSLSYINNTCVSSCGGRYYSFNNVCLLCDTGCLSCTSSTSCILCDKPTYFIQNTICVTNCTSTQYYKTTAFECLLCDAFCDGCSGNGSNCNKCQPSTVDTTYYKYEDSTCKISCSGDGYFIYFLTVYYCNNCDTTCKSCKVASNQCTSCKTGSYLYQASCYISSCPTKTFASGATCYDCLSECATCSNLVSCTSCVSGLLEKGACKANCSSGYYYNTTVLECLLCVSPCAECTNSTYCTSCIASYFLKSFDHVCVTPKPSNYYSYTSITGVPYITECNKMCLECNIISTNCTMCNSGELFYQNTCNSPCPSGTFTTNGVNCTDCTSPCSKCVGSSTKCTGCIYGYYLEGNLCVPKCSSGKYQSGSDCLSCGGDCKSCSVSNISCTECYMNGSKYLYTTNKSCESVLLDGFYSEPVLDSVGVISFYKAMACSLYCQKCISATICNICTTGKYNYKSDCISLCPSNSYISGTNCIDCSSSCLTCENSSSTCTSCYSGYVLTNSKCDTSCPEHYIAMSRVCTLCNDSCKTCEASANHCNSCYIGKYMYGGTCLDECPGGYYSDSTASCLSCTYPCAKCSSGSTCMSCVSSFYLIGSACQSSCPSEMVLNSDKTACISCSTGYLFVLGECKACQLPCLTCETRVDLCKTCTSDYVLVNGACKNSTSNPNNGTNNPPSNQTTTENNTNTIPIPFTLVALLFVLITYFVQIKNRLARFTSNALAILGVILLPALGIQFYMAMSVGNLIITMGSAIFGLGVYILMNLIGTIIVYTKKLSTDESYQFWKASHRHAPKLINAFSSIFTFHLMRFFFSRPLGFNALFVEFKDFFVLFVPLNILSICAIFVYHIELLGIEIYSMIVIKAWNQTMVAFLDCLVIQIIMIILMMYEIKFLRASHPQDLFEDLVTGRYQKLNLANDESFVNISMMSKSLSQIRTRRKNKGKRSKSKDNIELERTVKKERKVRGRRNSDPPSKAKRDEINKEMQSVLKGTKLPDREQFFDNIYTESRLKEINASPNVKKDCDAQTIPLHSMAMKKFLNKPLEIIPEEDRPGQSDRSVKEMNGIIVLNDTRAPFGENAGSSYDSMSRDKPVTYVEFQTDQPPANQSNLTTTKKKLKRVDDNLFNDGDSELIGKEDPNVNINDEVKKDVLPMPNLINDTNNPLTGLNSKHGTANHSIEKNEGNDDNYDFNIEKVDGEKALPEEDDKRLERARIIGDLDTDENGQLIIKQDANGKLIDKNGRRVNRHGYLIDEEGNILDKDGNIVINKDEIAFSDDEDQIINLAHEKLGTVRAKGDKQGEKAKDSELENSIKGLINQLNKNTDKNEPIQRKKSEELDARMDDTPSNYDFINQGLYTAEELREKLKPKVPKKEIRQNDESLFEPEEEQAATQKAPIPKPKKKGKRKHSKNKSNNGVDAKPDNEESFSTIQRNADIPDNNWMGQISSRGSEQSENRKQNAKLNDGLTPVSQNQQLDMMMQNPNMNMDARYDEDNASFNSHMNISNLLPKTNFSTNSKMKAIESVYLKRLGPKKASRRREGSVMSRKSSKQDRLISDLNKNYANMERQFNHASISPDRARNAFEAFS